MRWCIIGGDRDERKGLVCVKKSMTRGAIPAKLSRDGVHQLRLYVEYASDLELGAPPVFRWADSWIRTTAKAACVVCNTGTFFFLFRACRTAETKHKADRIADAGDQISSMQRKGGLHEGIRRDF